MIKVGILGAAGYTGGELIRLLLNHPEAEIVFANSESNAGNLVSDVHEGLIGETESYSSVLGMAKARHSSKSTPSQRTSRSSTSHKTSAFRAITTMSMVCQRSIKRRLPRRSMWPILVASPPVFKWPCCLPPI